MKTNKYTEIGVLLLVALLFPMISATSTLINPVDNGNYTGIINVNVTTDIINALNVSCLYNPLGDLATTSFIDIVNSSSSQTVFTGSVNVASYTDTATYNISCTVNNGTYNEIVSPASGITIDNTDPIVTLTVTFDDMTVSSGSVFDYKCSVADAIDSSVSSTFKITNPSSVETSLTVDSNNFLNFVDTNEVGDYVFSCTGEDYTGNTVTSTSTVTIDKLGRAVITQGSSHNNNNMLILLGLLAIIAWLYFKD